MPFRRRAWSVWASTANEATERQSQYPGRDRDRKGVIRHAPASTRRLRFPETSRSSTAPDWGEKYLPPPPASMAADISRGSSTARTASGCTRPKGNQDLRQPPPEYPGREQSVTNWGVVGGGGGAQFKCDDEHVNDEHRRVGRAS